MSHIYHEVIAFAVSALATLNVRVMATELFVSIAAVPAKIMEDKILPPSPVR